MFDLRLFTSQKAETLQLNNARILMVDDEPRLCESVKQLFLLRGYQVSVCSSGTEALSLLEREQFDLILLDLNLPGMDGHDIHQHILDMEVITPVIVVSGERSIDAAIKSLRNGVFDFVRKPYEPEELLKTAENAIYKTRLEMTNKVIQEKLRHSQNSYKYLIDSSPDLIYTLDEHGRFNFVNLQFENLLGFTQGELVGVHYTALVHEEDIDRAKFIFNERRTDNRTQHNVEFRLKCKNKQLPDSYRYFDNTFVTVVLKARGVYDHEGQTAPFLGTYGVARDISDRKKVEEAINYQAFHDALTDLPNRLLFKDRLGLSIIQSQRHGQKFAVMFVDLDRFKWVNDTLGHMHGDELLKMVSARLTSCLRKGDTLARIGGDEFTLLLPNINNKNDALITAKKILKELNLSFLIDGHEVFISASIGISLFPEHGDTIETLIKSADIAMYHVKWSGKNNYIFYRPDMNVVFHRKLTLENDLRRAIEGNQFFLQYQPQINIDRQCIVGMEVLIRWVHPENGLISPGEFISLAEETGLINQISDWVFHEACKQFSLWKQLGLDDITMSINFAPQDIQRDDFVKNIKRVMRKYELDYSILEIEITESTLMRDLENTVFKLREINSLGSKIAIDDFGTGFSSLSYLKKFPINTLKIDKSFVHDIQSNSTQDIPIVAAIIAIAQGFKMSVIAEGVENHQHMTVLSSLGCPVMQGYLFSQPLSAEAATNALYNQQQIFQHANLNFMLSM